MKVAIVHEWLSAYAGSERVVEQMLHCYPQADLYALVDFLPPGERSFLGGRPVRTSFIQRLPGARRHFRSYLSLMPLAVEQFDLSPYDLVISSSHAVAKGVLTGPYQLHVCYCYSPMRYAWDMQHEYLRGAGLDRGVKGWVARWQLHRLRQWDFGSAARVDRFLADSHHIARRIRKIYRRRATVIYPPVDVEAFPLHPEKEDFYLVVSRLVPYKRVELMVAAFADTARRLVVIGDGPGWRALHRTAPPNVTLLGSQSAESVRDHMQRARAFLMAAEEDFGIAAVEAQACGTPVIAYARGGVLETVRGADDTAPTGLFYAEPTATGLREAVDRFEAGVAALTPENCRRNAEGFAPERFREEFRATVDRAMERFAAGRA